MAGTTCEYVGVDQKVCGDPALHDRCPDCIKAFCPKCYGAHRNQEHPVIPELNIEPDESPAQAVPEAPVGSAFDPLFVDPDKVPAQAAPVEPPQEPAAEPETEEPVSEEEIGEMFSSEMDKVIQALNRLAARGLNQVAVIALIHDAEPKIPKSTITTVLKTLRQLPDIYGRKKPGRQKV